MKSKHLLLMLLLALLAPWAANAQETLTVCEGTTTTSNAPIRSGSGSQTEFVYPASMLEDMAGATITSVKFFSSSTTTTNYTSTVTVYVEEVEGTTESTSAWLYNQNTATKVYEGTTLSVKGGELEITFSTPYEYNGGNLCFNIWHTGNVSVNYYYLSTTGACGYDWSITPPVSSPFSTGSYLPKIEFTYEPAQAGCNKPDGFTPEHVTAESATLTWTGGSGTYNLEIKGGSYADWTPILSNTPLTTYTLSTEPTTSYQARVQSVCDGSTPTSGWKNVSFTTPCGAEPLNYVYGFEEADPFACWKVVSGNISRQTGNQHDGSYRLDFRGTTSNMIALPAIDAATNTLRIEFWTRPEQGSTTSTNSSSGKFEVGFMTDLEDASTFVAISGATYNSYEWPSQYSPVYVKKTVDFNNPIDNVPADAYIALRQFECATNYYWYVDDVTVKPVPSCVAPTALNADASTTEAELSWTANSGETAWTIYYKKTTEETYSEESVTENPYTLEHLVPSTNYQFYVVANCSASDASEPSDVYTFATDCEAIAAQGHTENFDGYTVASAYTAPSARVLPTCWSPINTTTYSTYAVFPTIYYYSSTNYAYNTPNCLKFYSTYSSFTDYDPQPQYAIMPEMTGLAGKQITLQARGLNTTSTFKIGTMSDPTDASTFEMIAEQALTTSYQEFAYLIPDNTTDRYVAIMIDAANSSRSSNGVYIDDIIIDNPPTCLKPSALACESKTAHTATLSWTNGEEGQTAWQIAYSTDPNFDQNSVTPVDVITNPATIENLTADNTYYAYVRADCGEGDYSYWNNVKVSFKTTVATAVPTGLAVDPASITSSEATVSWTGVQTNDYHVNFELYYSTTNEAPANTNAPLEASDNYITGIEGTSYTIEHLDPETPYYVWVRDNCGTDDYSSWTSSISFTTAADCQTPDGLAASGVTNEEAIISWNTYGKDQFNLRYKATDDEDWNTVGDVNSPYTIPGLRGNTQYQVQVNIPCQETWSTELTFTTECDPFTVDAEHSWTEDFETPVTTATYNTTTGLVVPDCWDNYYTNSSSAYVLPHIIKNNAGSSYNFSNPASQVLFYYGKDGYAILPKFENALSELQINFNWAVENKSYGTLKLGYITAEDNGTCNTFQEIKIFASSSATAAKAMQEAIVYLNNVPSEASRLVFLWTGTSNYYCNIDDIEVSLAPSCYPVGTLTHDNVGTHSVELSWPLVDNTQTSWQVQYATNSEFTEGVGTVEANTHENYTLSGLDPNEVHYWVRVRGNCGNDDFGDWSNVVDFTTLVACHAPSALTASDETPESMVLSWTNGDEGQDAWEIAYMKEGDDGFSYKNATTNPYTLTGLTDGKEYTLKVRANCGETDGWSAWSDEITYSTEASCSAPSNAAYSDVTAHGATITWNGEAPNHNIEYRTVSTTEVDVTYDFEDGTQGWTTIDADGYGNAWSRNNGGSHNTGSYSMRAKYNSTHAHQDYLVSPQITLGGTLSFYAKMESASYNDCFRVYLSTSGNEISDFTTELTNGDVTPGTNYGSEPYTYDLSNYSGTGYVAIVYTAAANQYYLYVDDINITSTVVSGYGEWQTVNNAISPHTFNTLTPETIYEVRVIGDCGSSTSPYSNVVSFTTLVACIPPTDLASANVTAHTADLSWDRNGNTTTEWEIDTNGYSFTVDVDATEPTYQLTGLKHNRAYTVKVRAHCNGEDPSAWSNSVNFTTNNATVAPTGLAVSNVKSDKATISWTGSTATNDHHDSYELYYSTSNVTPGDNPEASDNYITGIEETSYTIERLNPETPYYVWVRDNCGTTDGYSAWVGSENFTTLAACPVPENVTASNITNAAATLTWTADNDRYNVWYRQAGYVDGTPEEFGTAIPTGWENKVGLLDNVMNGTTQLTNGSQWSFGTSNSVFDNHARINIYGSGSSERKGWLITPTTAIDNGAALNFNLALTPFSTTSSTSPMDDDKFVVLITNDDESTWTILRKWDNAGSAFVYANISATGESVIIDLSSYAGQNVKIAFYGESTETGADMNLHIDNVTIGTMVNVADWTERNDLTETNIQLDGLTAETTYEVQVQGVCESVPTAWSNTIYFTTFAGFTKTIEANKWYAIASPMYNTTASNNRYYQTIKGKTNLVGTDFDYDLYRYNESDATWQNYKDNSNTEFDSLQAGRGYIYRRGGEGTTTLTFVGSPVSGAVNGSTSSSSYSSYFSNACTNADLKGFNLMGNPYNHDIYKGVAFGTSSAYFVTGWYELKDNGTWYTRTNNEPIAAGSAALVKVTGNYASWQISDNANPPSAKSAPVSNLAFTVSNSEYEDVTYAEFEDGEGLPKIAHLEADAPMLSIPVEGRNYAIAMLGADCEAFEMDFSGNAGDYTLAVNGLNAGVSYLHLIDRVAGKDIDLLGQKSYTFRATGSDASRFLVRLKAAEDETNGTFAYWNGSAWVVNGEGTLQVYDVMGRLLFSNEVSAQHSILNSQFPAAGVYVIRMGEKSQKIVVK